MALPSTSIGATARTPTRCTLGARFPDAARAAIGPGTGLVAAMLVNNEIGVIQPVEESAELAKAAGALMLVDAVRGFGRVAIPDGVERVAVSAHK
ncbi:aminotransferase class V-fold PLP-dependent enzyme, partial [Mycobacterium tuberculosis]|nr:aminotransferase class V-fold PLP-dependent enzyme [Mycobacterium tuberculosis]